jgi:outer membrane protein TolC
MLRSDRIHAVGRCALLLGLFVSTGCVHSQTDLQDRLARRVMPVERGAAALTSRAEVKATDQAARDVAVRPAGASQPNQESQARTRGNESTPLPPAIEGQLRGPDTEPSPSSVATLPVDSDQATLDALAATGKPLALPEAVELAFRSQPRLRAQLESIAQAQGQQQIVFSTFLPLVATNYDVGGFSLGVGGEPIRLGKGLPGFNVAPGIGVVPIGLGIGSSFQLAELKLQWLLLDFGRRLGRLEQARLALDVAQLQTDRAYQTVANDVAVAYNNVLRTQALRRTAQDALRRAEDELTDARKREREGVVEREIVLRAEVQRAETLQQLHSVTEGEFVALAELNLTMGLKSNQPIRVVETPSIPPLATSLADCLQTAVQERREFRVVRRLVEIAAEGGRVARADFAPKIIASGSVFDWQQQTDKGHVDFRLGIIRLEWVLFEGGRRIAATRVADSQLRQAMAEAESVADNIAFQVNEAYRNAVTAWVGIGDARPAVDQARENYRLVQLRLREGSATPTEITDAQASLTRAQQNYFNARYGYLIALSRLEYAMGVGQTPITHVARHP